MIRTIRVTNPARLAAKLAPASLKNRESVGAILDDVRKNGDAALLKYEERFSGAKLRSLRVSKAEIRSALKLVTAEQLRAIKLAKSRLERSESAIMSLLKSRTIVLGGARLSRKFLPIRSVGCYVPGGLARYPSSAIMSVTPAKVAGVRRIAVVSPPNPDGSADPLTVAAASICGATEIYKTGGAQAIAALSFGTKSIPRVDKLVGPGGPYVTLAKSIVSQHAAIDMLAGPTELGIVADRTADPMHVALDLVSQSEHSSQTCCYLITDSPKLAESVRAALRQLVKTIRRGKIVTQSLRQNGFAAVCKNRSQMAELAELLAPEHLQIMTRDPQKLASKITSPGLVLLGSQSPSAASDYVLGSNHILPTGRSSRTRGSLSVLDFVKLHTQIKSSRSELARVSSEMRALTEAEGLPNHYEALRGRLQ